MALVRQSPWREHADEALAQSAPAWQSSHEAQREVGAQPALQVQPPALQVPCPPHVSTRSQSVPVKQPLSQAHAPEAGLHVPCPLQVFVTSHEAPE